MRSATLASAYHISLKIGLSSGISEIAVPIIQSLGELVGER
jgi:hypothetical protein